MKAWMKRALVLLTTLTILSPGLIAQRGPGGSGQRGAQPGSPGPMTNPQQQQGQMGPGRGDMDRSQDRDRDRDRLRTYATGQQRDQFRSCTQSMDQLRTQSRDMRLASNDKSFSKETALQQQQKLQDRFRDMQQDQQRFMQALNNEQRAAMQQRTRQMEQIQQRISNQLEAMNHELGQANPSPARVREHSKNLEREAERLRVQYREMGQDLSLD